MKANQRLQFILATSTVVAFVLLQGGFAVSAMPGVAAAVDDQNAAAGSLTGVWEGAYANQLDIASKAYLNITEHADGSLTGRWGNDPQSSLTIEHGERVNSNVFQWEASSPANKVGRYRIRATLKGEKLHLNITYTWRENGKIKGLTAVSTLARK